MNERFFFDFLHFTLLVLRDRKYIALLTSHPRCRCHKFVFHICWLVSKSLMFRLNISFYRPLDLFFAALWNTVRELFYRQSIAIECQVYFFVVRERNFSYCFLFILYILRFYPTLNFLISLRTRMLDIFQKVSHV